MKKSNLKKVTIAGSGVLGFQIAFQTAFHGYEVMVYDINDDVLVNAKNKFAPLSETYKKELNATDKQIDETYKNLSYSSNLEDALSDADLLIEAIPENLEIKKEFYEKAGKFAPEKTVFCTNSSTLLPSSIMDFTGRPEKFLALHFANNIHVRNTAEVMGTEKTDKKYFDQIVDFATSIGMVALPIYKEKAGYILNSLLVPFLRAGLDLWVDDIATPETIDKTWMIATGSPYGPMAIMDINGMATSVNILKASAAKGDEQAAKIAEKLEQEFVNKGKMGVSSGEGFYKYPSPAYLQKDFLKK